MNLTLVLWLCYRENRYPFLHKIGEWNRDRAKTGDTLVEKCCHFFDLFRLITGQEAALSKIRALAQRGINYSDEQDPFETPIIDSAYVTMPFRKQEDPGVRWSNAIGCLELCMFAEGSRHQEEIIVTGTKVRPVHAIIAISLQRGSSETNLLLLLCHFRVDWRPIFLRIRSIFLKGHRMSSGKIAAFPPHQVVFASMCLTAPTSRVYMALRMKFLRMVAITTVAQQSNGTIS